MAMFDKAETGVDQKRRALKRTLAKRGCPFGETMSLGQLETLEEMTRGATEEASGERPAKDAIRLTAREQSLFAALAQMAVGFHRAADRGEVVYDQLCPVGQTMSDWWITALPAAEELQRLCDLMSRPS